MMKKNLRSFLELTEVARPMEQAFAAPGRRQALIALNELARLEDGLPAQAAWRLEAACARRLEAREGYTPPGGWAALAGLACGCGVLEAGRERFRSIIEPERLAAWREQDCERRLVEAFSVRLVPPGSAAGLFIMLGIHPAWGLRLAHEFAGVSVLEGSEERRTWGNSALFPPEVVGLLTRATFDAIAAFLETLRVLSPDHLYPIDALASWMGEVCRGARSRATEALRDIEVGSMPPFLVGRGLDIVDSPGRLRDFTARDLLDAILVPAGVVQRFEDDTFCVVGDVLSRVEVQGLDAGGRAEAFDLAISGELSSMVA